MRSTIKPFRKEHTLDFNSEQINGKKRIQRLVMITSTFFAFRITQLDVWKTSDQFCKTSDPKFVDDILKKDF